jgi:phosphomannomutase
LAALQRNNMNLNSVILREYDIRGTFEKTLTTGDALALGRRFSHMMRLNNLKTVAVCRDGRISSPSLRNALVQGLVAGGVQVIDIGVGPTPMLYFAVKNTPCDAGIMVTGSHNPPKDNGFKMALYTRPFFGKDIQNLAAYDLKDVKTPGHVGEVCVQEAYINRLLKDYTPTEKRLKIVWDPGNGAAGNVLQALIRTGKIEADHILLNEAIDGNFPAHHPDPTVPENLQQMKCAILENGYDLGIAFDGDGDRVGVMDNWGRILWGDQLMVLWSRAVLESNPGATIIADVKASQTLFDAITEMGGQAIMAKTGHSLIKSKMAETGALLAGEMSGHIFFADTYYGYDDALYAAIRLLNILHATAKPLSSMLDELPQCINTPEIRIECDESEKFQLVEKVKAALVADGATFSDVDGVRVMTPDGWWLLRASNTQAILVARCEASSDAGLTALKNQLFHYLKGAGFAP